MKVGIVGAGPIGLGGAALLASRGHHPFVWSPRRPLVGAAANELEIRTAGLLTTRVVVPAISSPSGLADAEVVLFCVLGNGHKAVMDAIAPHLREGQTVVISSHSSLGALYLSRLLAQRGVAVPILALATTLTGGPIVNGEVQIRLLRNELDVAAVPVAALEQGLALLQSLFGDLFVPSVDLVAISLSNLNPQIHMANALLNFTRIENGERWDNYGAITACVGRLIEALDEERVALARAFGVRVRTAREHYLKSFSGLKEGGSVHEMAQIVNAQRAGSSPGPTSIRSRYLTEDLPFGICSTLAIARVAGVPMPLHEAGLALFSATCGHDFERDNDLLPALDLSGMTAEELHARARDGWPWPQRKKAGPARTS
jgi:opine dehydrogenase